MEKLDAGKKELCGIELIDENDYIFIFFPSHPWDCTGKTLTLELDLDLKTNSTTYYWLYAATAAAKSLQSCPTL